MLYNFPFDIDTILAAEMQLYEKMMPMFLKSNVNGQYFLDIFIRDYDEFTLIRGESEA